MYTELMSEWNYTKCAKPFESEQDAEVFMAQKDFAGYLLKRDNGYSAVCLLPGRSGRPRSGECRR